LYVIAVLEAELAQRSKPEEDEIAGVVDGIMALVE